MSDTYAEWEKLSPSEKREEFDSYHLHAEIDFSRRQQSDMMRLRENQQKRNPDYRDDLLKQQKQLEANQGASGWRKFVRDVTGRSADEQEQLQAVQKSLADMALRESQEQEQLGRKQEAEEARRVEDMVRRRAYIEKRIAEVAKQQQPAHERMQADFKRAAHEPVRSTFKRAASDQQRSEEPRQPSVIEKDHTPKVSPEFNDSARQEYIARRLAEASPEAPSRARNVAPDRGHGRD